MKAKQSGSPKEWVHRCFVVYGQRPFGAALALASAFPILSKGAEDLYDYAQVYVHQYFEPAPHLKLSEDAKGRSQALAHFATGRALETKGRTEEAIEAYTEVLRHQPDQLFLARKTAHLLARSGRLEEALPLLEDSLARNPDHSLAHVALSEFLATYLGSDTAALSRALSVAQEAAKRFPQEPAVHEHLVKILLSAGRQEEARAAVTQAAQQEQDDAQFWLRLGRLALHVLPTGSDSSASALADEIFGKALAHAKGEVNVIARVAEYYHASSQYDRAIHAYTEALVREPERVDLRERLARAYGAKGDGEKEIETYQSIVSIDPENAEIHKRIAGIFLQSERYQEAIPHLRSALAITKGGVEEYSALGRMMLDQKEFEASIEFLQSSGELFPEAADFPFLLTFAFAGVERWEEALGAFENTLKLAAEKQPHLLNEYFYFRYAAAQERSGHFDEAEKLFRKTIEMIAQNDPDDKNQEFTATVYNYLGYMWLENDIKIDEAGELIKTAVELAPDSGAIADSMGWYYFKKGQYEAARDELLRAEVLIEQEDPVVFDHIGQVYHQLGEREKAIEYLERAVALDPEKKEFTDRLQQYKAPPSEAPPAATAEAPPSGG